MDSEQPIAKLTVEIEDKPVFNDKEAQANLKALGLTYISAQKVRKLAALGVEFKGLGVMRLGTGLAVHGQLLVHDCMVQLSKRLHRRGAQPDVEEMVALAKAMGFSLSKLTESQKFVLEAERPNIKQHDGPPRVQAFPPAVPVLINVNGGKVEVDKKAVATENTGG